MIRGWKNAISSGHVFVIIGVILLGLVAGSVALSPSIGRATSEVITTQSSSSSVYSTFSTSSSTSTISSSSQTSSYTTSSQSNSTTVSANTTNASLVLGPTSGPPGSQFTFTFIGGEATTEYHEQSFYQQDMPFTTNSNGSFIGTITVPWTKQHGTYIVFINDSSGSVVAQAPFTVTTSTTKTSLSCTPVTIGENSTCTVTVSGNNPTGTVNFTSTDRGAGFNPSNQCTLSPSGSCSITYSPFKAGFATIAANYPGDNNNGPSSDSSKLNVGIYSSTVYISCSPNPVANGSTTTCTVTVSGYNPLGSVTWQSNGIGAFSSNTCNLSSGQCQVTYSALDMPGSTVTISASYSGDKNNGASSDTYSLDVSHRHDFSVSQKEKSI